ncbi:hypothetical protein ACN47A_33540 [Myxococcus fulvus]|uniref:hypothetical protein n=1 Tax=Myxococcus fulvus TaxID=33 RepID=UPI003B9C9F2C
MREAWQGEPLCTDSVSGGRERGRKRTDVATRLSRISALGGDLCCASGWVGSRAAKQGARTRGVGVSSHRSSSGGML